MMPVKQVNFWILVILLTISELNAQEGKGVTSTPAAVDALAGFTVINPADLDYNEEQERIDCSNVDLREEMQRRNLPDRRDQDTTGWCYAFATSDLLSYKFGVNVSPADVAVQTIEQNSEQFHAEDILAGTPLRQRFPLGGGFINLALDAMQGQGVCLENDFPSEDSLVADVETNARTVSEDSGTEENECSECLTQEMYNSIFTLPSLVPVFDLIHDEQFKRVLVRMAQGTCSQRRFVGEEFNVRGLWHGVSATEKITKEDVIHLVDQEMNQQNLVGIMFDSGILSKLMESSGQRANHAASIAGRRFNEEKHRCEYLIRNSESGCGLYLSDYDCENNHVWVPRQIVQRGIGGAYAID